MADCVTSLAGVPLDVGAWGVDFAYSCTQKCLAAPPGMSPVAVSERALERLRSRRTPVPFSFDLLLLERYWIDRPVTYHHTAPILGIYALHEALRSVLARGSRRAGNGTPRPPRTSRLRWNRAASSSSRTPTTGSRRSPRCACPRAWTARPSRPACSASTASRSAAGSGPDAPAMWRIGLMGRNASVETADRVLDALDAVLAERARARARRLTGYAAAAGQVLADHEAEALEQPGTESGCISRP